MNKFLTLTEEQQRTVFREVSSRVHLPVAAIEKDFWVTEVLNMIYDDIKPTFDDILESARRIEQMFRLS